MMNVTRRQFLALSAAASALVITGCGGSDGDDNSSSEGSTGGNNGTGTNTKIIGTMPDEAEPHTALGWFLVLLIKFMSLKTSMVYVTT